MSRTLRIILAALVVAYAITFIPLLKRSEGLMEQVPLAIAFVVAVIAAVWLVVGKDKET